MAVAVLLCPTDHHFAPVTHLVSAPLTVPTTFTAPMSFNFTAHHPSPTQDDASGDATSAGCTAVCALVHKGVLYVANAGDSRAVLCRNGVAVAMSHDHKPNDEVELARITKAGGMVVDGRVNGSLNLSRALGDLEYKQSGELPPEEQMVTAFPEVRGGARGHEWGCGGVVRVLAGWWCCGVTNLSALRFDPDVLLDLSAGVRVTASASSHS